MKSRFLLIICVMMSAWAVNAQDAFRVRLTDARTHLPLKEVAVGSDNILLTHTDSLGQASFKLSTGSHTLFFSLVDYKTTTMLVHSPDTNVLMVSMEPTGADLEEVVVVASTRNDEKIENSPLKVEVLGKEELSEEAGIKPGNIASILGDVSGVQIQQLSATSGNSNVRIQGLDGRYTQIIRDGMPLYDGFSGGFGILTIPPLDLQQIELVKGSASTLFGGGAIGGLINLISRRPTFKQEADVLVNYTTLSEFNTNVYLAKRNKQFGYTLFTGYTNQQAKDVNGDGFSDVPKINSFMVHPRLFFYPSSKTIITLGYTGTFDNRRGGDMMVLKDQPDMVHQYYESNRSGRNTVEYIADHFFTGNVKLTLKGDVSNFDRNTQTNLYQLRGNQVSYYNEASVYLPIGKDNLVAGINVMGDQYKTKSPDTASLQSFSNFTTGLFGQYSYHLKENTTVEGGLRLDLHHTYGLFALPRIALFHRFNEHWATRLGFGMGYKTPNPLVQQNIEYNILDIQPLSNNIKPEVSYGYNAEVNYKKEWDREHSLFINQAFFLTQINKPIIFQPGQNDKLALTNASDPLQSTGFDTYLKLKLAEWEVYMGYTFTVVNGYNGLPNGYAPITPRNRASLVLTWEVEGKWRFGIESSYTGSQYRYDRTTTPGYVFAAAMIQRNVGRHISIVLNCENLFDYRMSNVESLYIGSITNPMFKPLWAPIDGRVINLSLRWKL